VFFRDLKSGKTQLAGVYGTPAEDDFGSLTMSANGRYVAFDSVGSPDIHVRDMQTGSLRRVGVDDRGGQSSGVIVEASLDATGRYLAFSFQPTSPSPTGAATQVRVRDLSAGTTRPVSVSDTGSQGDGNSGEPVISADGRYLAFSSNSTNLSPENINRQTQVFLRGPLN
jgi:Tol biopolymer transport system component